MKGNRIASALAYLAWLAVSSALLLAAALAGLELIKVHELYGTLKGLGPRSQNLGILTSDAWLGWKPSDGTFDRLPLLGDPVRVDIRDGLLTYGEAGGQGDVLLALGGSWTALPVPRNYAQAAGELVGAQPMVGAWGSYGLAHFLIMARKYTPSVKPDYLVVQYSDWSLQRATQVFAPTLFGALPNPYFYRQANGRLGLQPPVFLTNTYDLPFRHYSETDRSLLDRLSFTWKVGLPYYIHNDFHRYSYRTASWLGRYPRPARPEPEVASQAFAEISDLCEANGARLFVLLFGFSEIDPRIVEAIRGSGNLVVVDGVEALYSQLTQRTETAFFERYGWWRGDPPMLFEKHPNERAHQIVGTALAEAIRKANGE